MNNCISNSQVVFLSDSYEWRRDDVVFPHRRTSHGNIVINNPTASDEGLYQCFAENSVGTAMSNTTQVKRARQASFEATDTSLQKRATVGMHLRLDCNPIRQSIPSPTFQDFSWQDDSNSKWHTSDRVQIDDNGMCVYPTLQYALYGVERELCYCVHSSSQYCAHRLCRG